MGKESKATVKISRVKDLNQTQLPQYLTYLGEASRRTQAWKLMRMMWRPRFAWLTPDMFGREQH